ncbi:UNVERIFIED_CONTAM: hypothetical protein PYX00_008982 [Menopon gallinae]|uniref:Rho-related GTP-binding protein RhoU n=1 Tax=Menopon gallinae TaxID=328185 RepID=A0AAW2H9P7_9NEOP
MMPPCSVGCENALLEKRKNEIVCEKQNKIKCVLVGDGKVGKTSLVVSYSTNGFPTDYVPTAFDNYNVVVMVDNQPVSVQLCDTAGHDDFDPIRTLCYPETDVFMVCFSVVNPTSFNNVRQKWVPEIRKYWPDAPVLLVGTQSDRKGDVRLLNQLAANREVPVTEQQAKALASCLGLKGYIETSALTQKQLKDAFDNAILCALSRRKPMHGSSTTSRARMNKVYPRGRWRKLLCCIQKQTD